MAANIAGRINRAWKAADGIFRDSLASLTLEEFHAHLKDAFSDMTPETFATHLRAYEFSEERITRYIGIIYGKEERN